MGKWGSGKTIVICFIDLDGTIADHKERLLKAGKEPMTRGKAYTQWLKKIQNEHLLSLDLPVPGMWNLAMALAYSELSRVAYLTGRSEIYRNVTTEWLMTHNFPPGPLIMRPKGNRQRNGVLKERLIKEYISTFSFLMTPIMVIDDDYVGDIEAACHKNEWTFLKAKSGGSYE